MIKPLAKNIVLEKEEIKETCINGIYLPENEKSKSNIAKIVAISEEIKNNKELNIDLNNRVLYREYSGTEVEYNNKKLIVINIDDILGIIE